jgi:hypothetical protein
MANPPRGRAIISIIEHFLFLLVIPNRVSESLIKDSASLRLSLRDIFRLDASNVDLSIIKKRRITVCHRYWRLKGDRTLVELTRLSYVLKTKTQTI